MPLLGATRPQLQNLVSIGLDGKCHGCDRTDGLVGSAAPMMNLASTQEKDLDIDLGTTEYVLISMWFAFTAGVFGLLYKITKEADEECEENIKRVRGISVAQMEDNLV